MEELTQVQALVVQQKKEWGEILSGFETKNKYAVLDTRGRQLFLAAEESSFFSRWFLKKARPLVIHILSSQGSLILKLNRPFRFFLSEISISDSTGRKLGLIKQNFSIFTRRFTVSDATGREIYKIKGPFFHPWTFQILRNDNEVGKILKKWSGIGKEFFTDSDNFSITFPINADAEQKSILLGALFLIDLVYFEKSD